MMAVQTLLPRNTFRMRYYREFCIGMRIFLEGRKIFGR